MQAIIDEMPERYLPDGTKIDPRNKFNQRTNRAV